MTKNNMALRKCASAYDISHRAKSDERSSESSQESRQSCYTHPKLDEIMQRIREQKSRKVQAIAGQPSCILMTPPAPSSLSVLELKDPEHYTQPFCDFLTENPTVFHAVAAIAKDLETAGYSRLSERDPWKLKRGGKYFATRNGSSLIAFAVGPKYEPGNGAAVVAGHIDAVTARLKPISELPTKAGYTQLGVAPYAGGLNDTWWDRDLGIGGRVLVREGGKVVTKLVKLGYPIARIPTLAPHFGAAARGPFNKETQMVPIIGLERDGDTSSGVKESVECKVSVLEGAGSFASTQPSRLVKAIAGELGITDRKS